MTFQTSPCCEGMMFAVGNATSICLPCKKAWTIEELMEAILLETEASL